jgi:excinuclease UvrABC ATPase subunit
VLALPEGTRLYILAPVVRDRKGEYKKEIADWLKRGFQRLKIDGQYYEIANAPVLDKKFKHNIDVVVDRIVVRADIKQRLAESFETALALAEGMAVAEFADGAAVEGKRLKGSHAEERMLVSEKFACPVSGFTIAEIEPRLFSFNNPFGACPTCDGLGVKLYFDPVLIVPDGRRSLKGGAVAPWSLGGQPSPYYMQALDSVADHFGVSTATPWDDLPEDARNAVLFGTGKTTVRMTYSDGPRQFTVERPFEGVIPNTERRWRETESANIRDELSRYQASAPCETCAGKRLKPEALAVKIAGGGERFRRWSGCRPARSQGAPASAPAARLSDRTALQRRHAAACVAARIHQPRPQSRSRDPHLRPARSGIRAGRHRGPAHRRPRHGRDSTAGGIRDRSAARGTAAAGRRRDGRGARSEHRRGAAPPLSTAARA